MTRILVTGANGLLGQSLRMVAADYASLNFVFADSNQLNITDRARVFDFFESGKFHYCINCAAYTNVEKAETDEDNAFLVNATGAQNVAEACLKTDTVLIHISTDYVFNGEKETGYRTDDAPDPINVYGKSKLQGERQIQHILSRYYIIRTSWLYAAYGKNFYTTILNRAKNGDKLQVTSSERGCPTQASQLAAYLVRTIILGSESFGIYHFTDGEISTWYDFACRILRENGLEEKVKVESVTLKWGKVNRPKNSVLI